MDHDAGGVLTVAVTAGVSEIERYLQDLVTYPEALRVTEAPHSIEELHALATTLVAEQGKSSVFFEGVRIDERANQIEVVTPRPLPEVRRWVETKVGTDAPVQYIEASIETVGTQFNNPPLCGEVRH